VADFITTDYIEARAASDAPDLRAERSLAFARGVA
jgi:hypothetical protein